MANSAYVSRLIVGGVPTYSAPTLDRIFKYILGTLKLGRVDPGETVVNRGANLQMYPLAATTHATPNTEFSVVHGLPVVPYVLVPVLPLDVVGAKIVPLTVTKAADTVRVYLSSSVASAPIRFFVEG